MFRFSLSLLVLLLASCVPSPAQAQIGGAAFNQEGYPAIAIVGIVFLLVLAIAAGSKSGSTGSFKTYIFFTVFNAYIWLAGFFLIFGPEAGPRVEVLGLSLALNAILGFYAVLVNIYQLHLFYAVFAIHNVLSLIGSNYLFNYTTAIWLTVTAGCNGYFLDVPLTRCQDDKFLQFLRVIGTSAILFLAVTAVQSFTYWVEGGNKSAYGRGAAQAQAPAYVNNSPAYGNSAGREGQGLVVQPQQPVYTQPPPV